ncbi:MAG: spore cortex biosynthesis protein YabQ [Kineothrix sp.]|nr:spore cortex biosynthesis protein YabQ [Kineothrix sp.]
MSQEIVQELTFFTHSAFMGLIITFAYDWIRVLRKLFKHGTALVSVEDFFFWLICGIGVFYMLYKENDGTLRWFAVLGATLGMFLYKMLVRDAFVDVMSTCIHKIMWLIFRVLQVVLKPLKCLIFAAKTFVLHAKNKLKKCKEFIKKRLTALKKTIRMILCKR